MATPKRSKLELEAADALANSVEDVTDIAARVAGHSATLDDEEAIRMDRETKIELYVKEHGVPRPIAIIMADTGYSKGTANRIFNDTAKRERAKREAAQVSGQARGAKQPAGATA
jgi:hypothetical protein